MAEARSCEECAKYVYDEEYECYECQMYLDEDEIIRISSGASGTCPYFQFEDEYRIVRKQM